MADQGKFKVWRNDHTEKPGFVPRGKYGLFCFFIIIVVCRRIYLLNFVFEFSEFCDFLAPLLILLHLLDQRLIINNRYTQFSMGEKDKEVQEIVEIENDNTAEAKIARITKYGVNRFSKVKVDDIKLKEVMKTTLYSLLGVFSFF